MVMRQRADRQSEQAEGKRLLSISDVAEQCGVCERTVRTWIAEDGLPVHRIPGRGARGIHRVAQDDLDEWIRRYRHNFAEEKKEKPQTMRLDGRRFFRAS